MPIHNVVYYVNHKDRTFSLTARMTRARLPAVDNQMRRGKFEIHEIARNVSKKCAESIKANLKEAMNCTGYRYMTRAPI